MRPYESMHRYVCVHGHFYQPPRENPWLERVEVQASAYPYHDWNERIAAECYGPNAAARILDGEGRVARVVNNYGRISFDFGPTLLAWLAEQAPETYAALLAADRESRARFAGHGSALAQPYHHAILPLAHPRDKRTEVLWGLRDFAHRFGRPAEGAWLPEAAVDLESLDLLAAEGVRFTLLEPGQARRCREIGELGDGGWSDARAGLDLTRPYRLALPSGRSIAVFFYQGALSRAIAFERLLDDGGAFAGRLLAAFSPDPRPQLVHVATDGETYGHHHRFGEMALAYALDRLERPDLTPGARLTNYGEFLALHPPAAEVEIHEGTSWSCAHGVERWRGDCGCSTGGEWGWNQAWREPLRAALDGLRDALAPRWEEAAGRLFADPWAARDEAVDLLLDRSGRAVDAFLARHAGRLLAGAERDRALALLELQRNLLRMYTSCGWFFNDLAGIETVQILRYADRALHLAEQLLGGGAGHCAEIEEPFLRRLEQARSNQPEIGDGRFLYESQVRTARVEEGEGIATPPAQEPWESGSTA